MAAILIARAGHRARPGARRSGRSRSCMPAGSETRSVRMLNTMRTTPFTHCMHSAVLLVTISRPPQGRALTATRVRLLEWMGVAPA